MKKSELQTTILTLVIGIPILIINSIYEAFGAVLPIMKLVAGVILFFVFSEISAKKRRSQLLEKYGDENLVDLLMRKRFWEGQDAEQLLDALGQPVAVDDKRLKTKKKQIWRYNHRGANRYALRITLENDVVVGWDQKSW